MDLYLTRRQLLELTAGAAAVAISPSAKAESAAARASAAPTHLAQMGSPIPEPFAFLHGGQFTDPDIPESPDPLIRYRWDNPRASDDLQYYVLHPVSIVTETLGAFKTIRRDGDAGDVIAVQDVGSIRFDFGVVSAAWIEFDSMDLSGNVEMSISEFDEPAIENSGPEHRLKTFAPKRYGDTWRLELNKDLYEGVRFGWIHVRNFDMPWHITGVRAVCQVKPTNYDGAFACSDLILSRIWYTGAYGVKVNLCKDYFGALLMDRGDRFSWTGDAHPAQAAALTALGNRDFIKQNLEATAKTGNGIESYSLYWVQSLLDYYWHTGDTDTMRKYIDHTKNALAHGLSVYSNPNIVFFGHDERLGASFEAPTRPETIAAYRMLFVRACQNFAAAVETLGESDLGKQYRDIAAQKMTQLRTDERWFELLGVHALADAVNTGLTTEAEQSRIFDLEFADRLNRLSYSPFNQYFILQAMARMARFDEALVTVRDMWGGQIAYGATTFLESYTPSWNDIIRKNGAVPSCQCGYTSLAHAWGAGVTAWLSHEVLGIKPTAPGFARVDISPNLGTSLNWVSGTVPTPNGPVTVQFDRKSGSGRVTIPHGSIGRIGVPTVGRALERVVVNGAVAWEGEFQAVTGVGGATLRKGVLYLNDVQPGAYDFSIRTRGNLPKITSPRMVYPIPAATENSSRGGNWGGAWGRDGYVLFNYDGVGKDRRVLPAYLAAVSTSTGTYGSCQHAQLSDSTTERRAPAAGPLNDGVRKVGTLYTGPSADWSRQTMTVDVALVADRACELTLYFVDWEKLGRRQAIELFDLRTLKRLAPVQLVQDFAEGKYLAFSCRGSVRIRINKIRGESAVLNGLFFDSAPIE